MEKKLFDARLAIVLVRGEMEDTTIKEGKLFKDGEMIPEGKELIGQIREVTNRISDVIQTEMNMFRSAEELELLSTYDISLPTSALISDKTLLENTTRLNEYVEKNHKGLVIDENELEVLQRTSVKALRTLKAFMNSMDNITDTIFIETVMLSKDDYDTMIGLLSSTRSTSENNVAELWKGILIAMFQLSGYKLTELRVMTMDSIPEETPDVVNIVRV